MACIQPFKSSSSSFVHFSKIAYAKALAGRIGMAEHDIPAAALATKVGASAFIDSLSNQIPPTTKQLDYVTKLCQKHNMNPSTVGDRTRSFKVILLVLLCSISFEIFSILSGSARRVNLLKPYVSLVEHLIFLLFFVRRPPTSSRSYWG